MFKIDIIPYTLLFKRPAGTSRGVYTDHNVWYIIIKNMKNSTQFGIGECAPLKDLSSDYDKEYEYHLRKFCKNIEEKQSIDVSPLRDFPSILFGLETAMRQYNRQSWQLWDSPFSRGEEGILINGLIWMGSFPEMKQGVESAIDKGFRCIKLKIGAIDFDKEVELLSLIRKKHSAKEIEIRVDANGGFTPSDALEKLNVIKDFEIHSIEQPIKPGNWDEMFYLCRNSPIPIALDEELIGINDFEEKQRLLSNIRPQFIILKPSLHGGISGCEEWISIAEAKGISYWITSALESDIGLNSISQWASTLNNQIPQGLGTGSLYSNNVPMPLYIKGERLWFNPEGLFPKQYDIGNE